MKLRILSAIVLALTASAGFAKPIPTPTAREAVPAPKPTANARKAETVIGHDGQDAAQRCSAGNPNIEYRDCVNASTRDSNAKVRLA